MIAWQMWAFSIILLVHFGIHFCSVQSTTNVDSISAGPTYETDCTPNQNERFRCTVKAECDGKYVTEDDAKVPHKPFDLRAFPLMLANPRRRPNPYALQVNVTFSPPTQKSIVHVIGFEVLFINMETSAEYCFEMLLQNPQFSVEDTDRLPQFKFSTVDWFKFGAEYRIEVQSLPKSMNGTVQNYATTTLKMPAHPGFNTTTCSPTYVMTEQPLPEGSYNCSLGPVGPAHPNAHQWISAFRHVNIYTAYQEVFVEFVAAPPQYCFDSYVVRLIDERRPSLQPAAYGTVSAETLTTEHYDSFTCQYGSYTFRDVKPGNYMLTVSASKHRADGRCVCMSQTQICSCINSQLATVQMPSATPPPWRTLMPPTHLPDFKGKERNLASEDERPVGWIVCAVLTAVFLFLLIGACVLFYRRYDMKAMMGKYLLPLGAHRIDQFGDNKHAAVATKEPVKVLLVYTHDCPEHERVVEALAAFLRTQCNCDVKCDSLALNEIMQNKHDWVYRQLLDCPKVIVVNSVGTYLRYHAKLSRPAMLLERKDPTQNDDVFLMQWDLIRDLSHKQSNDSFGKFLMVRFDYTPASCVLPGVTDHVQYELMKHLDSLASNLHDQPLFVAYEPSCKDETSKVLVHGVDFDSIEAQRLKSCIQAMRTMAAAKPDWFDALHTRRYLGASVSSAKNGHIFMDGVVRSAENSSPLLPRDQVPQDVTATVEEALSIDDDSPSDEVDLVRQPLLAANGTLVKDPMQTADSGIVSDYSNTLSSLSAETKSLV